jgi:hypothetical protein
MREEEMLRVRDLRGVREGHKKWMDKKNLKFISLLLDIDIDYRRSSKLIKTGMEKFCGKHKYYASPKRVHWMQHPELSSGA